MNDMEDENLIDPEFESEYDLPLDYWEQEGIEDGALLYKANGVEITIWPAYKNVIIDTDKYHLYWYPGSELARVYMQANTKLIGSMSADTSFEFPMSSLSSISRMNAKRIIVYSSSEMVNDYVERLWNVKSFL